MRPSSFLLGVHHVEWVGRTAHPLLLSLPSFDRRHGRHIATGPWALDSGGFSALSRYGHYLWSASSYVSKVHSACAECGTPLWVACQDWMCEPSVLLRTGLAVAEHQRRTVQSYRDLCALSPSVPWLPVLQGYSLTDYLRCLALYAYAGVPLRRGALVGIGSVCRRQRTEELRAVLAPLSRLGLRLHGFGVKATGLRSCADLLWSADSCAWSYRLRRAGTHLCSLPTPPYPTNCLPCALIWRQSLLASVTWRQAPMGVS